MRKKILFVLALMTFSVAGIYAQNIVGGAGVIHVDSDPNGIPSLQNMSTTEGHVAYDRTNDILYFYDNDAVIPAPKWIAVDIASLTDPIISVTAAPGDTELNITNDGNGNIVIGLESGADITYDNVTNMLTYTDIDGHPGTPIDLSGLNQNLSNGDGTFVSGTGTATDPYKINLEGFATATDGQVPTKNATGGIDWEALVQSAEFLATGELELTLTDGSKVKVNMENIPAVANRSELDNAATAVDAASGGIARAAENNTFGLPANAGTGVLFFISN